MAVDIVNELIAPDGASLVLDQAAGYFVTGLDDGGLPPLEVSRYRLPLQDGAVLGDVLATERPVILMVQVVGDDYSGMAARMAALVDIVKPYRLQAPGALRYWTLKRTMDGTSATLHVVPSGLIKEGVRGHGRVVGVRLEALDPFWYSPTAETVYMAPAKSLDVNYIVGKQGGRLIESLDGGLDGPVYAFAEDPNTGDLYVGGDFTYSDSGTLLNNIAKWDGSAWVALGSGPGLGGAVRALCFKDGHLYVGGDFAAYDHILLYNTTADIFILFDGGVGTNGNVYAITTDGTNLYIGGAFTTAGGVSAARVAKWNGSAWSALGTGMNSTVTSLVWDAAASVLYAGGYFTTAGGKTANYVAKWALAEWTSLGTASLDDAVLALALGDGVLYVGGLFEHVGSIVMYGFAIWDGLTWLEPGINPYQVRSLYYDAVSGAVYIGAGVPSTYYLYEARDLGPGSVQLSTVAICDGEVLAVYMTSNRAIQVGGSFTTASDAVVNRVFSWSLCGWNSMLAGADSAIYAVVHGPDGSIYVGGSFVNIGGVAANRVARWKDGAWEKLGSGIDNGTVYCLAVGPDGSLYAGGTFTYIGGSVRQRIAKWDGAAWSALGTGAIDTVFALEVAPNGDLYAGGAFNSMGGVGYTKYIARWDGSAWDPLGIGMNGGFVRALKYDGQSETLYAGGLFTEAGGVAAPYIAKWDGSAWSALAGGDLNGGVYALAFGPGGLLYVGGAFTTAGGAEALRLVQWNGNAWYPVGGSAGTGINGTVLSLAYSGDGSLYLAGVFTTAGGLSLPDRVARWNGYVYSALTIDLPGSGSVYTIDVDEDNNVYLGGDFAGTASALAVTGVMNPGGLNSPVVFTVTGPGTLVSLCNESTGEEMLFNLWINAGEVLTVNLIPGETAITSSWRGRLEALPNSDWSLSMAADPVCAKGENAIGVFVLGATGAAAAQVVFTPRWYSWENAVLSG